MMKKTTKAVVALAATAALTFGATPAFASAWGGDNVDFTVPADGNWAISNADLDYSGPFSSYWSSGQDNSTFDSGFNVYDATEAWQLGCDTADLSTASDGSGDQIILCDPETDVDLGGSGLVDVTAEIRLYADNATARLLLTITNSGTSTVTGSTIEIYNNWYQDSYTNIEYSPTLGSLVANWPNGNADTAEVLTDADNVFAIDCPTAKCDPSYTPASVFQAYGADGAVKSTLSPDYDPAGGDAANSDANDEAVFLYDLPDIAAGQSVQLINMTRSYDFQDGVDNTATGVNALAATNLAIAFAQGGGWANDNAQLIAGIADFSKVVNFSPASTPELPNTGVDTVSATAAGFGALALVVAGLGIVVARRRSNA